MLINLDKFMITEMQERGFDVNYNKMVEIYRASRQRPECIRRKIAKRREEELLMQIDEQMSALNSK